MQRIILFLATNLAGVVVLSLFMNIFGVGRYLTANGIDPTQLLIFSAIIGFSGATISLLMSKWMAKQSTRAYVIDPQAPRNAREAWLVDTVHQLADRAGIGRPEDRKSTRLNSSHVAISYAVFCLKIKMSLAL